MSVTHDPTPIQLSRKDPKKLVVQPMFDSITFEKAFDSLLEKYINDKSLNVKSWFDICNKKLRSQFNKELIKLLNPETDSAIIKRLSNHNFAHGSSTLNAYYILRFKDSSTASKGRKSRKRKRIVDPLGNDLLVPKLNTEETDKKWVEGI